MTRPNLWRHATPCAAAVAAALAACGALAAAPRLPQCRVALSAGSPYAQVLAGDGTIVEFGVEGAPADGVVLSDCDGMRVTAGRVQVTHAEGTQTCDTKSPCAVPRSLGRLINDVRAQVSLLKNGLSRGMAQDETRLPVGPVADPSALRTWRIARAPGRFWSLTVQDASRGEEVHASEGSAAEVVLAPVFQPGRTYAWTLSLGSAKQSGTFRLLDAVAASRLRDLTVPPPGALCMSAIRGHLARMAEEGLVFEQLLLLERAVDDC